MNRVLKPNILDGHLECKIQITSMLCHWAGIIVKGKPEISSSIDSVALPFGALRIKKGFILEIYNVEWNEYLTECSIVLSKRLSISEAHNWLYAAFQKK